MVARNSHLKVLFTVSPIRHIRDGMHANQLSKSTYLLLAIDRLQQLFPDHVFYFPSYEIVLDELRDYRYYADDMLHPSPLAVRYLWERFSEAFFFCRNEAGDHRYRRYYLKTCHKAFSSGVGSVSTLFRQIVLKNRTT